MASVVDIRSGFEVEQKDRIRVNEIFQSIQSEGNYAGTPATFIRLQGCSVGCSFCNVKHTWTAPTATRTHSILDKTESGSELWSWMVPPEILKIITENKYPRHVVITGGEPLEQYDALVALCRKLTDSKAIKMVQIETSGIGHVVMVPEFDKEKTWFTFSPKIEKAPTSPIGYMGLGLRRWDEYKIPIAKSQDFIDFVRFIKEAEASPLWLQPVNGCPEATALCVDYALKFSATSASTAKVALPATGVR